ncbi:extracellular solute-binding protein [Paenibacillus thermotolerans]|uniref:extracellular solute-binding protein n=1 Tax=Paenibacillus thermotolerans TaxID=3027807 RepID=UPI002368191F|nr:MULTISPECIES: extracellular solute-binding protein [unclassified Paenibacillus]
MSSFGRKGVHVLLILALIVGTLLGCTKSNNTNETTEGNDEETDKVVTNKKVRFSYLRPTWGPATYYKGGAYEKELFKQGNVEIDVQIIPVIEFDAKINTILAAGDLPDVVWANGPVRKRDRDLQSQGAFMPINKYLEQYPAIKEAVPQGIWDKLKDDKGDIYFIPNLIYPIVPFVIYYRQDWFEKLNIPEPKTIDEFVNALRAIKDGDPDGNGKKDTVPFTMGYEWSFKDMGTSFGFGQNTWEPSPSDPNTIVPWFSKDKEIDAYFWLQSLHAEGLLDPEFKVNAEPNFAEDKFKAGKVAVVPGHWGGYIDHVTKLRQVDPSAKVGIMSPLIGPDGAQGGTRSVFPMDRGFYISSKAKDPDGIFRYLNWTLTDGSDLRRYGIEDKMFKMKEGNRIPIPDADRENDFKNPQIEPLRFLDPMSEKLDWEKIKLNYEGAGLADDFEYVKSKFEEYAKVDYPDYRDPTVASPTEDEKGTNLWNDYMEQIVQSAIINHNVKKSDWLNALQKWKNAGGQQIIDEINELQKDKSKPNYLD